MNIKFKVLSAVRRYKINSLAIVRRLASVEGAVSYDVLFHCCVQKTASRWVMKLLSDGVVYQRTGLLHFDYPAQYSRVPDLGGRKIFPECRKGALVSPLYFSYSEFSEVPKPSAWMAFFVLRHPLDVWVSFYFSTLHSHRSNPVIDTRRAILQECDKNTGLHKSFDFLVEDGIFDSMLEWVSAAPSHENILITRFEELTGPDQFEKIRELFSFLEIQMPDAALKTLLSKCSFENLSRGRSVGDQDISSHYRRGVSGDWRNHLKDEHVKKLDSQFPALLERLGYSL